MHDKNERAPWNDTRSMKYVYTHISGLFCALYVGRARTREGKHKCAYTTQLACVREALYINESPNGPKCIYIVTHKPMRDTRAEHIERVPHADKGRHGRGTRTKTLRKQHRMTDVDASTP